MKQRLRSPEPLYGGRQLGCLAVNAKARAAQLNGFRSIAAAAEGPVTFGGCFYRWEARLLDGWVGLKFGSGIGGRVRTPAPTEHTEGYPVNAVGADDLGGPRAHSVRPYGENRTGSVG